MHLFVNVINISLIVPLGLNWAVRPSSGLEITLTDLKSHKIFGCLMWRYTWWRYEWFVFFLLHGGVQHNTPDRQLGCSAVYKIRKHANLDLLQQNTFRRGRAGAVGRYALQSATRSLPEFPKKGQLDFPSMKMKMLLLLHRVHGCLSMKLRPQMGMIINYLNAWVLSDCSAISSWSHWD